MALSKEEKQVIHEALGTLAAERVRITMETNESVVKSIKLRETERQLAKCYENLAQLIEEKPSTLITPTS